MIRQQPDGSYIDDETGQPADVGQGVMGGQAGSTAAPTIAKNLSPPPPPEPGATPAAGGARTPIMAPIAQPEQPAPFTPAAPPKLVTDATSTTTSGIDRKSREAILSAEKQQEQILKQREGTAERAGVVAEGEARDAAASAAEEQRVAEEKAARQQQIISEGEQGYQRAIKTYDDEYRKWKSMDIEDFYAGDKGRERGLWSAMTIALGGLAQGQMARAQILAGGVPTAQNEGVGLVQKRIDEDYQRQREKIAKQFQVAERARGDVDRARADEAHALNMLNIQTAAKSDAVAAKMAAMMAARGIDKSAIAKDETILGLQQQSATLRAQVAQTTANHFQSTVSKKMQEGGAAGAGAAGGRVTEDQRKAAALATGMLHELNIISGAPALSAKTLDRMQRNEQAAQALDHTATSGIGGSIVAGVARAAGAPRSKYEGLTPGEQKIANAWDNLVEQYARTLTGAGMPVEEANRMARQDAPVAGDTREVIQQKLDRMKQRAQAMLSTSGAAAASTLPTLGAQPGGGRAIARTGTTPDGRRIVQYTDGSVEYQSGVASR